MPGIVVQEIGFRWRTMRKCNGKALALRIEKAIAASPDFVAREALLRIALVVVVAACLFAGMSELGRLSSRQVAALAGLAPFDRQSGKTSWPGRCSGGSPSVRRSLYLAALTIARSRDGHLVARTSRLREAGKPFKLAIVGTMRKLLVKLNPMVKSNTKYRRA